MTTRALEAHGLVEPVDERRWGGLTERLFMASAASYVVSPAALGAAATDPGRTADRLSARYVIALAARVVREVGALARRADAAGKRLPTLAIDTEIRFRSAAERAAFSDDLAAAVTGLVARYHDASASGGRAHRLVVVAHPLPIAPRPRRRHDRRRRRSPPAPLRPGRARGPRHAGGGLGGDRHRPGDHDLVRARRRGRARGRRDAAALRRPRRRRVRRHGLGSAPALPRPGRPDRARGLRRGAQRRHLPRAARQQRLRRRLGRPALLHVDVPAPGTALLAAVPVGEGVQVMVHAYLYGDGAEEIAAREHAAWSAWLEARFAAPDAARA